MDPSGQSHSPQGPPLHAFFPPFIPVPRHRPLSTHSTGFLEFYKPGLEQSSPEVKHPEFSILGDTWGKNLIFMKKTNQQIVPHPSFSPKCPHLIPGYTVASWDLHSLERDKEDAVFRGAHMVRVLPHSLTLPRCQEGAAQMVPAWCQGLPVARTPRDNKGNEAFWLEIRCQFLAAEDWIPISKGEMDLLSPGLEMWWRPEKRCSGASSLIQVWEVSWGPHTCSSVSFVPQGTMSNLSLV